MQAMAFQRATLNCCIATEMHYKEQLPENQSKMG